jgi:exportin-5
MTRLEDHPHYPAYSEAVKELHSLASHELRKLSMRCADYFFVSHYQHSLAKLLD